MIVAIQQVVMTGIEFVFFFGKAKKNKTPGMFKMSQTDARRKINGCLNQNTFQIKTLLIEIFVHYHFDECDQDYSSAED